MYSYGLLETGCYYLVQEKVDSPITLIRPATASDHCMYVFVYNDETVTEWKKKSDKIYDIIECLSDEAIEEWEKEYNSNNEAYYEEDEE